MYVRETMTNVDGRGRMGGATARSVWYSMTLEPEGGLGIVVYMPCPCYDLGHMGWGSKWLGPLFHIVLYIEKPPR